MKCDDQATEEGGITEAKTRFIARLLVADILVATGLPPRFIANASLAIKSRKGRAEKSPGGPSRGEFSIIEAAAPYFAAEPSETGSVPCAVIDLAGGK